MTTDISKILEERKSTHGSFKEFSRKEEEGLFWLASSPNWSKMTYEMRAALRMTIHKITRTLVGNPYEPDHWVDMQGYTRLGEQGVRDFLEGAKPTEAE